jgi:hypothetical protein
MFYHNPSQFKQFTNQPSPQGQYIPKFDGGNNHQIQQSQYPPDYRDPQSQGGYDYNHGYVNSNNNRRPQPQVPPPQAQIYIPQQSQPSQTQQQILPQSIPIQQQSKSNPQLPPSTYRTPRPTKNSSSSERSSVVSTSSSVSTRPLFSGPPEGVYDGNENEQDETGSGSSFPITPVTDPGSTGSGGGVGVKLNGSKSVKEDRKLSVNLGVEEDDEEDDVQAQTWNWGPNQQLVTPSSTIERESDDDDDVSQDNTWLVLPGQRKDVSHLLEGVEPGISSLVKDVTEAIKMMGMEGGESESTLKGDEGTLKNQTNVPDLIRSQSNTSAEDGHSDKGSSDGDDDVDGNTWQNFPSLRVDEASPLTNVEKVSDPSTVAEPEKKKKPEIRVEIPSSTNSQGRKTTGPRSMTTISSSTPTPTPSEETSRKEFRKDKMERLKTQPLSARSSPISRTPSFLRRESNWAFRPSVEQLYENLQEFFPGHDLDKPIIETSDELTSSVGSESLGGAVDVEAVKDTHSFNRGISHKKSIRRVAQDGKKRLQNQGVLKADAPVSEGGGGGLLRRKSTKLWGTKMEEVTAADAAKLRKNSMGTIPESPTEDEENCK